MSRAQLTSTVEQNTGGAVAPFVAGKNKIINGDFGIWQRGTSFTNLNGYFADRFQIVASGSSTSVTTTQQTFTPGTAPVAGYESSYFARNTITTPGSMINLDIQQRIEDVRTFAGQTVTLSFWAKGDSPRTSLVYLFQSFGSGGSGDLYISTPSLSITTSWIRYSFTFSVASIAGKTIGTSNYLGVGIRQVVAAGSVLDIWGVQLEAGSVATAFTTATGTFQGELAACQRYYEKSYNQSVAPGSTTSPTFVYDLYAGQGRTSSSFKVAKRTVATITLYSPSNGSAGYIDVGGGPVTGNVNAPSETGFSTYTSSGYGSAYYLNYNWVASAEL
jgi:hypothetical protein